VIKELNLHFSAEPDAHLGGQNSAKAHYFIKLERKSQSRLAIKGMRG